MRLNSHGDAISVKPSTGFLAVLAALYSCRTGVPAVDVDTKMLTLKCSDCS